jgi:ribose transport system substrate-binding protein
MVGDKRWTVCAAAVCAAIGAGGCGGSSGSSSSASATPSSPGVKTAKAFVASRLGPPTSVGLPPISKRPPRSKFVVYVNCGAPSCTIIGQGIAEATKALGWRYQEITPAQASAESVAQAWNQVVALHPDGVIGTGNPTALFAPQLAQLGQQGGVFVSGSVPEQPHGPYIAAVSPNPDFAQIGQWEANWVVADTNGKANVAYFYVTAYPSQIAPHDAFVATLKQLCPTCGFSQLIVNPADAGGSLPQKIVNYIQSHPSVNYIVPSYGDLMLGVPQALRNAGLDTRVKAITSSSDPSDYAAIKAGEVEDAAVAEDNYVSGWVMVDAIVRHVVGDAVVQSYYNVLGHQFITKQNLPADITTKPYIGVRDYRQQFFKLWRLG